MGIRNTVYISVDVEADGPIPGPFSMLSFGAAVAGFHEAQGFRATDPQAQTFYRELRPISEDFVPEALAISGLDRDHLMGEGTPPPQAMAEFAHWVEATADGAKPVLVAYPACYDWMFVYWYLIKFHGKSPFGHSGCLDMKAMYATKADVPISATGKRSMPRHLLSSRPHTHHALDDAIEQAELFANLQRWKG
jgi:hypothetical protein